MIPKSEKLLAEESKSEVVKKAEASQSAPRLQIREVKCYNDFVAILQFEHDGVIARPEESKLKNEGLVVGVGPGISDGAGGRLKSQVAVGDVVMFTGKPNATIESQSPPYAGQCVIIISERNLLCKLSTKVDFEYYQDAKI